MRAMKNSGFSWIGEIPFDWTLLRARFVFEQKNEKGNKYCLQLLSPTQKYGVIPQSLYDEISGMNAVKLNEKVNLNELKTMHKGAFCISLRSFQGGFEYSEYEGVVSPAYQVFYPSIEVVDAYYRYLFKTAAFIEKMNSYTMSLRDGKNISFSDFANTYIPIPPLEEQKQIASFLDSKCAEINALSADIKKEIDLLEEYRKSVITKAVTKGLDPTVQMRNSGVDWIGQIPEGWTLSKVRYIGSLQNGISKGGESFGHGFPFVSYGDVYKNIALPEVVEGLVESNQEEQFRYSVHKGDIFFTRTSETIEEVGFASTCEKTIEKATFAGFVIRLRPENEKLETAFAKFYFRSEHLRLYLVKEMNLVTRASLSQGLLKNMAVCVPPKEEQKIIADFLNKKCEEINGIILSQYSGL